MQPECFLSFLVKKLNEEAGELIEAVMQYEKAKERVSGNKDMSGWLNQIQLESADVANIAMMIADNVGAYNE